MVKTEHARGRFARMEQNQVEGAIRQAAGRAQGAAGNLLGDAKTEVEGAIREVAGKAQEAYGAASEMARDAADSFDRGVQQQPLIALLIVGALGYVLGLLTASARR